MKKPLAILQHIHPVEAPEHLYDKILDAVNEKKVVPLSWVSVAAAVLLALASIDMYCILEQDTSQDDIVLVEALSPLPNNTLYDD